MVLDHLHLFYWDFWNTHKSTCPKNSNEIELFIIAILLLIIILLWRKTRKLKKSSKNENMNSKTIDASEKICITDDFNLVMYDINRRAFKKYTGQ